jgi:hypothetical protein
MQPPEPQPEHQWLQRLIGDWTYEHECVMGPDEPPMKSSGRQTTRALGGVWILTEIVWDAPDGNEVRSIIQLGYDPQKQRFLGSFISSCMTHFWPYCGTLDGEKKILTLDSEGPSFADEGATAKYQDIIEIISDDHHTMTSQYLAPDGQWVRFMTGQYRRVTP